MWLLLPIHFINKSVCLTNSFIKLYIVKYVLKNVYLSNIFMNKNRNIVSIDI